MAEPLFLDWNHQGQRNAENIAAAAIVAAKVYAEFGWVRYTFGQPQFEPDSYHVPDAESIAEVLTDLARRALAVPEQEHDRQVGHLRFIAYSDDVGPESDVEFFLGIGSTNVHRDPQIGCRAIGGER